MKNLIFLILNLSICGAVIFAQNPPPPPPAPAIDYSPQRWNDFVSVEDGFKARFPREPQFFTVIDSATGAVLGREYRDGAENFVVYQIKIAEIPAQRKSIVAENPQKAFEEFKTEDLNRFGAETKVISEKSLTVGGCPARLNEFDVAPNLRYRILNALCGEKLYRASVKSFRSKDDDANAKIADAFLKSFAPLTADETKQLKSTAVKYDGKFYETFTRFGVAFPAAPKITLEAGKDKYDFDYESEADKLIFSADVKTISNEFSFSENYRNKLYDSFRQGIAEGSEAKILAENKIVINGIAARDLTIQIPPTGTKVEYRLIAVDGRFFILSVIDSAEKKTPERQKIAAAATKKFFDSFEKLPEFNAPKYVGIVENDRYTTEFYGFSLTVPKNWQIVGGQLITLSPDENEEDTSLDEPEHSQSEPVFLTAIKPDETTKKNNTLHITGTFYGEQKTDYKKLAAEMTKKVLAEDSKVKVISPFGLSKISGKDIWQAEIETTLDSGVKTKAKIYYFFHNNYLININGFYFGEIEKAEIENSVKSLRFF